MKLFLRFGIFVLLFSAFAAEKTQASKPPVKHRHRHVAAHSTAPETSITDSMSVAAWQKKLPWAYRDNAFSIYRDTLLRPLFKAHNLGPGSLFKRGGFVEIVFPRGRPLHEDAYEIESLCEETGIKVLDGHEYDPPEERIEYHLQAPTGEPLALRLTLGKTISSGTGRMALIIVSLDSIPESEAKRLTDFPIALTFAVPEDSFSIAPQWQHLPSDKAALLELPMEPSNYPFTKPGPGALFIHHSRADVERLLKERLKPYPQAIGFSTTFGDRAIENRPLLTNVLRFTSQRSLLFLDLTTSTRSLTSSVALQTSATVYSAHIQEPVSEDKYEAELLKRCNFAGKTGQGIWVLRYSPALPDMLEKLLSKDKEHFDEIGLQWVTLDALARSKN